MPSLELGRALPGKQKPGGGFAGGSGTSSQPGLRYGCTSPRGDKTGWSRASENFYDKETLFVMWMDAFVECVWLGLQDGAGLQPELLRSVRRII